MRSLLVLLVALAFGYYGIVPIMGQLPEGQSSNYVAKRVFLKYPSSFVNLTSESWKTSEIEDEVIFAVKFEAKSIIGQILSIRFIKPEGQLEALLTVGIIEGHLQFDLFNSNREKILNKPIGNLPINVNEQNLALGLNATSRSIWYRIGNVSDLHAEINQQINISNTEIVVTLGGGGQSMIGCVSLVAVSVAGRNPVADVHAIASQDTGSCPERDECTTRDCNTGHCVLLEVPVCDCFSTEMTGPNCRKPGATIKLQNNDDEEAESAFIRYNPPDDSKAVYRLAMDFRFGDPDLKEGILVYGLTTEGAIFKIYVVGSKGLVVLDSKNLLEFEMKSNDDEFHTVIVRFANSSLQLYVDAAIQKEHMEDKLSFETIQFGAPITNGTVSDIGVTACVKNLYIDHYDLIDLMENKDQRVLSNKVRPCSEGDQLVSEVQGPKLFKPDPLVIVDGNDADVADEKTTDDEEDEPLKPVVGADLFPSPPKIPAPPKYKTGSSCEKSQDYMCQNGASCRKSYDPEIMFTCACRTGYIGRFCQFSTLPRSCSEANDFHKLPNGPTRIDIDGRKKLEPSVAMCSDGTTVVPHDMKENTVVRDTGFQNHSLFSISYRDFKPWQLTKLLTTSQHCIQSLTYRCNKAPLGFKNGRTWFKSAQNSTRRIKQMAFLPYSCTCIDTGCQSGEKCNCDSGAISEDQGTLFGKNAGITEIVTLYDAAEVHAEMTLGELRCSGYSQQEYPIRFVTKTELNVKEWSGESIGLQFRTNDASGTILSVRGKNDEEIIKVSLADGYTLIVSHLDKIRSIDSQYKLNDTQWHQILIELSDGQIRFGIDSTNILMSIEDNVVLSGNVIISSSLEGFIGCVRSVHINDDPVQLHDLVENRADIETTCEDRCTKNYCQNNSKCYEDFVSETPFCLCAFPSIQSGTNCEIDMNINSSVSFHGGHLKLDNVENVLTSPIYFSFRTDQTHGLLFFAHDQNNNFLQIHLSEELNIHLTYNNLNIITGCSVRAQGGTEFGDMRWIQVAVTHGEKATHLQVDDSACTVRSEHILSDTPNLRFINVFHLDIVRLPIGLMSPINPDPFTVTFIANVDVGTTTNDGSILLAPRYESPIPRLFGCVRGLQINKKLIDVRELAKKVDDDSLVRVGCEVGCESVNCYNGGHCSVAWTNYDPTARKTSCDCSRTSYAGAACSLDDGVTFSSGGWLDFNIGSELSRIFVDKSTVPQLFKFAFSSSRAGQQAIEKKQRIALVKFSDGKELEIELNQNRTINVAITYENGRADVLNFPGDFADGYRHFFVVQTSPTHATAVMIDSLRVDFPFKDYDRNVDLFKASKVQFGLLDGEEEETDERTKTGFIGCVSNILIDFQRGASLAFTPIGYLSNFGHRLHALVTSKNTERGACANFQIPNSLPVYQNRVEFPFWETSFARHVYHGAIEEFNESTPGDWNEQDSGSLLWVLCIIIILALVFLLACYIFMTCCRERVHHAHNELNYGPDAYESVPLHRTYRPSAQPSPPAIPKQLVPSDYTIPAPNVNFNNKGDDHSRATSITSSGISGYFTAQEAPERDDDELEDDDFVNLTLKGSDDKSSISGGTIRHIDEDDENGVVSRPQQVNHLAPRMSSFRNGGDPTAPRDSPLYGEPKKPANLTAANVPVPPPRISSNQ